jgi:hypothetical protein
MLVIAGNEPKEDVLAATASFFSHAGAVSYWKRDDKKQIFVLSSKYGSQLNDDYWSSKIVDLFKIVKHYSDSPEDVRSELKQNFQNDLMVRTALRSEPVATVFAS